MPSTSFSEIKSARFCEKSWAYRYRERLRRKKPARSLFLGSLLHEMLHAYYLARVLLRKFKENMGSGKGSPPGPYDILDQYKKKYKSLFREEREEFGDIPELAETIFENYLRRWKGDGLVYLESEAPIITDLTNNIRLIGYVDNIVQDSDGRRFLMERKSHKTLPGPQDRFSDIQTLLYFWAWNQSHPKSEQLDGVIWDYLRTKAPTKPDLLKNGSLSKRANIDTDRRTYLKEIKKHGLDPDDYKDILKSLEGKEKTFFERVILPNPPKKMVESVVEDARATITIRLALQDIAPRHMSPRTCNLCEFRQLCEAEVRGLDSDFIRKRDYIVTERYSERNNGNAEG